MGSDLATPRPLTDDEEAALRSDLDAMTLTGWGGGNIWVLRRLLSTVDRSRAIEAAAERIVRESAFTNFGSPTTYPSESALRDLRAALDPATTEPKEPE